MTADARTVLGMLVGGPTTTTIGCLGAAQVDRAGNLNSTQLSPERFLVGSGGGNDVASRAAECLAVTLLRPGRTPERVGYVTGPGERVRTVVTDLGVLRKADGDELRLAAVPAGSEPVAERVRRAVQACGWPLDTEREVGELAPVSAAEVAVLRGWDRHRWFLAGG
jgi:acyl CoA:acetate/3-ketoacid CoA transferase beta subunit